MRRSEQREHIFKLLFMTQFNSEDEMSDQVSMYFETLGELEEKDQEAMQEKYQKILEKLDEIDQILNDYSRGWKTSRMSRVDLTALRLAVYEMKFDEDVPVGVAINEAVELAKMFGGDDSGSFVNGILGKIASGKKDSGEAPKRRRPTYQAKIIIRSSEHLRSLLLLLLLQLRFQPGIHSGSHRILCMHALCFLSYHPYR